MRLQAAAQPARIQFRGMRKAAPVLLLSTLLLSSAALAQNGAAPSALPDPLQAGFLQPPESAKPRVWWHWMNGNISKEGIRLDLEWMHRVGIGGFQNFDAALSTPQVVDHRLAYMTPEWKDAFKYATILADQFGMEEAIAGSPGWSETGGPWVPPSEAMKKYVWSETVVDGGKPFTGKLPDPPTVTGKFQNTPEAPAANATKPPAEFYADSAVIAYRIPAAEAPLPSPAFTTSEGKRVDAAALSDQNAATAIRAGEPLSEANMASRRPGDGASPTRYWDLLGTPARRDYLEGEPIDG